MVWVALSVETKAFGSEAFESGDSSRGLGVKKLNLNECCWLMLCVVFVALF